jgi:hypothetical protein
MASRGKPASTFASQPLLIQIAAHTLEELAPGFDRGVLQDLLRVFARWVFDLPASERNHHAQPFGFQEHSLEVAVTALQDLAHRWRASQCGLFIEPEMLPELAWTTFAVGLFHDCGKILDVEVGAGPGGEIWNPMEEGLQDFLARQPGRAAGPSAARFLRSRGLPDHGAIGFRLAHRILGFRFDAHLPWGVFSTVYFAFLHRLDRRRWLAPTRVAYLADLIHQADERSARADRWRAVVNSDPGAARAQERTGKQT